MVGSLMNNELETIWKEALMAWFKVLLGICLDGLRETTEILSQDGWSLGWDLNAMLLNIQLEY